jgi:hypothetical protein
MQQLPLPLAHLDGVNGVISCDLLDGLATADRLHGDPALNSGLWVQRLLIGGSPDQGRYPVSEVHDGACPEKPVHLTLWWHYTTRQLGVVSHQVRQQSSSVSRCWGERQPSAECFLRRL